VLASAVDRPRVNVSTAPFAACRARPWASLRSSRRPSSR
jgi:hypothetical protein